MPTGGVSPNREIIQEWIKAGACCLGMGSNLIRKERLTNGAFDEITEDVRQSLAWITSART